MNQLHFTILTVGVTTPRGQANISNVDQFELTDASPADVYRTALRRLNEKFEEHTNGRALSVLFYHRESTDKPG